MTSESDSTHRILSGKKTAKVPLTVKMAVLVTSMTGMLDARKN